MKNLAFEFIKCLDISMDYPFGSDVSIPTLGELRSLEMIENCKDIDELVKSIKFILSDFDCYNLWIYAVRMTILSGNTGCSKYAYGALWCVVIAAERIDWRDALVGLSIIEHSGKRGGFDVFEIFDKFSKFLTEDGKNVIDGYRGRSDIMRSIEVMGYDFDGFNKYVKK